MISKWITDLIVGAKPITFLEENTGADLCDQGCRSGFLGTTPKARATKEKEDLISIKKVYASKDTIRKVRKSAEWEKTFVNHISDKGFVFRLAQERTI